MDIPHSKHIHSPSWDQQNTGATGRRRDAAPTLHIHQHSGSDSFFNRVFGHHSSAESSRAGSPTPPANNNSNTKSTDTNSTKKTSRHIRNSSAGHIPTPVSYTNTPISIIPPITNKPPMQRRRSLDGPSSLQMEPNNNLRTTTTSNNNSKKPTPTPLSSVSARVTSPIPTVRTPNNRNGLSAPKINTSSVPFPRGGRQIGAATENHLSGTGSSERRVPVEDPPTKKRNLFRFGKKKTYTPTTNTANSSTTTSSSTNSNAMSLRKKSSDDYRPYILDNMSMTASDVQRQYYQQRMKENERKKSASSNGSHRKKENNGKSLKDQALYFKLDQNFERMDGIVNREYYKPGSTAPPSIVSTLINNENMSYDGDAWREYWVAPDSWGVAQPPSIMSTTTIAINEEEHTDFDDYQIEVQERLHTQANIRIYRQDKTYNTLHVPLNATTAVVLKKLATKCFMSDVDITKQNLVMKRHNLERILGLTERPLQIQKVLQEQMGYMDQDKIDDCTYLIRFQMVPITLQPTNDEKDFGQDVDLQARSLATIPICLYRYAFKLLTLNISSNLQIELPNDFVQMCDVLKKLVLDNNEYTTLPPAIRYISSLEDLQISGNRLQDLDHAHLDEITGLRTLCAFNNRLESLPDSFGTCFPYLTTLTISNNSFTKFPMVICEIESLANLDISFNKIQIFPDEIGQLKNLISLFAIANRITGSLPSTFSNLKKLKELDIRQNLITDLDVVSSLPSLEKLKVDYNSTSIVNFEIKSLKKLTMYKNHLTQFNLTSISGGGNNLTELNLSNCKLSSLPEDLFQNTLGLERLVLDSNTLNALPSSIGALQRLIRLSIQNNNLETLPSEIGKLSSLQALDAQKNNLKSLPKEIWLCAALQILNCSSNLLESFPDPLSTLTTPSTPLSSAAADLEIICDQEDDLITMLPTTLNAGQGVIKRLDRLLDYNTQSSFKSLTSPVTPNIQQNNTQDYPFPSSPIHPTALNTNDATNNTSTNDSPLSSSSPPPPPPNFNPPSFFASPRNHPPPLSLTLRQLFLGDNRLTDDVWSPLSLFLELRTLNLSFNDLYEIPPEGLCHQHLYELYLSGNQLTSLPADDIAKLQYMRVFAVNGNKLQTLPAEIGKLRKLLVLDVGNNVLKYNIANWFYDWNWNWNLGLKYLNLSGNKRLTIKKMHQDLKNNDDKDLSDFSALLKLRMLGLMDITIVGVSVPEEFHDRRVRTSPSEVNSMSYGVADWLGPSDHLSTWDLVMPRFRSKEDECIFALFDGSKHPQSGCRLTKQLNDTLIAQFTKELGSIRSDDTIVSAVRRVFLGLEHSLGTSSYIIDKNSGASAVVCYISGTKLYVANVGDALAVISRNNGQAFEITQKHIPLNPSEVSRIRAAGGYVSNSGLLNDTLNVSRSFGHFHLIPVVNCNPFVSTIELAENDEFVIMASRGLWDRMTYQTAVDIARTEKDDLMAAAQKLRDFAITYGATDNLMVMVIGVGDLFDKRDKRYRNNRGNNGTGRGTGTTETTEDGLLVKSSKRRGKEEVPGDSTLARLEREVAPPVSQLALVFTDIKSSTQFWETQPENMRSAIKIHDAIMRRTLRSVGGYEVKTEGDAFMVCFKNITAALLWCFTVQLQLLEADWPAGILETVEGREVEKNDVVIYKGLSVRMGIHWGTPVFERNPITQRMDYFGPVVNKASRICNAADGGQICVSSDVIAALRNFPSMFDVDAEQLVNNPNTDPSDSFSGSFPVSRDLLQLKQLGFHVIELGERRLKGLETPETLSLVYSKQLLGRYIPESIELSTVTSNPTTANDLISPKPTPGSVASPDSQLDTPSASNMTDYLTARPDLLTGRKTVRTINPNLVCAMSNLAIRLERLTSGNVLSQNMAGSSIHRQYTLNDSEGLSNTVSTAHSGLGLMLDRHIREDANDEELMVMMENCVTRVENAVSSLYLHKMGNFTTVLEKLGEAVDMDPMHIIKALQMFAEASSMM